MSKPERQARQESRGLVLVREYSEVLAVITAVTVVDRFLPLSYTAFGDIYLLAVIALSLRVGRWPVLFAAVVASVVPLP